MNFKQFLEENEANLSNLDIAGLYFDGKDSVRHLSNETKKSIPEIYRIIHSFGKPNRRKMQHDTVRSLADSGMKPEKVSEFTGYSKRHVLNILKNGNNNK
jgi:hypothetical protein